MMGMTNIFGKFRKNVAKAQRSTISMSVEKCKENDRC